MNPKNIADLFRITLYMLDSFLLWLILEQRESVLWICFVVLVLPEG
jgi:hypothetical protein